MKFEKIYNNIYNLIFSLFTVVYILKFVNIEKIDGINTFLLLGSLFLFILHSLLFRITFLKILTMLLVLVFMIPNITNRFSFFEIICFFLLYTINLKSNKNFLKIHFFTITLTTITIILFSLVGIIDNYSIIRFSGNVRQSFGFSHPNSLGLMFFAITVSYLSAFKIKKYPLITYVLLICFNLLELYVADSRTSGFLCIFIILVTYIIDKLRLLDKNIKSIYINTIILASILGIVILSVDFNFSDFHIFWNSFFTNRIYSNYEFIREYGIHWFGSIIADYLVTPFGIVIIDGGYIGLLLKKGIIVFCMFFGFIFFRIQRNTYSFKEAILLGSIFISLMFESYGFSIFLFPILSLEYVNHRKE